MLAVHASTTRGSAAYNVLVHGRKRWFLMPSSSAFYSTQQPLTWQHLSLPHTPHVLQCIQDAGLPVHMLPGH